MSSAFYFLVFFFTFFVSIENLPPGHIRHVMLYEFLQDHSSRQAATNMENVYGEGSISKSTCDRWFAKFRSGDDSLKDEPGRGADPLLDDAKLLEALANNRRATLNELGEELGVVASTVSRHLHALGFKWKLGAWLPHDLTDPQKWQRSSVSASLLSRYERKSFLPRIVTGDEKWVLSVNTRRKRQWVGPGEKPEPVPKPEFHQMKFMLSVFWDMEGVLFWELLDRRKTINAIKYSEQLGKLNDSLHEKRPSKTKVILLHDNSRPHTAKLARSKIHSLDWEVLSHAPYSPDLAPSDYHLFRSMSNELVDEKFDSKKDVEKWLQKFFDQKPKSFYERGIQQLPTNEHKSLIIMEIIWNNFMVSC